VDADEVMDYDGVVDHARQFTESLKQARFIWLFVLEIDLNWRDTGKFTHLSLDVQTPSLQTIRKSLSEFLERLIASSAELGSLYTSELMATLQTWVVAMSSSQIRSFRHTATVVALEVETALCDVAAAVDKEADIVGRPARSREEAKGRWW